MFLSHIELREKFFEFFEKRGHKILKSASLIPENDSSILFNSAGMVPFKDMFLGKIKSSNKRIATIQKCVRTNDIENIGMTNRHLSFFEMIGNFSFGDYFKKEAILWAWEFLIDEIKLQKEKLYVTIYKDDMEAFEIWREIIDENRIIKLGEDTNFWSIGKIGPCGPCSEILFDRGEQFGCNKANCQPGCDCDRYLEVWNLVFTQFDIQENGDLKPLAQKNIDTGMGLERILSVVQNVESVYETDVFQSIWQGIFDIAKKRSLKIIENKKAFRIICDHLRSSVFLICDGVFPANEGRGYVLKRLIRRATRQGNKIGLYNFLQNLSSKVIENMKEVYPYLIEKQELCFEILKSEEEKFQETILNAEKFFNEIKAKYEKKDEKIINGKDAFKLFDTYGLPFDLIEELADEANLGINRKEYDAEMQKQKELSRNIAEGWAIEEDSIKKSLKKIIDENKDKYSIDQKFVGYTNTEIKTEILDIIKFENNEIIKLDFADTNFGEIGIILKETPFYAESGGQKSDFGAIEAYKDDNFLELIAKFEVKNSKKYSIDGKNIIVNFGEIKIGKLDLGTKNVRAKIDIERRNAIKRNHTSTHLLQAILRKYLGNNVEQAGSEVRDDGFRFDFTYSKSIDFSIIQNIELEINKIILDAYKVQTFDMNLDEAKKVGALSLFDEKYGVKVRVVKIGNSENWRNNISLEFCGGTHVNNTSEIGSFKILSESSVASGVRRIEGITGLAVYDFLHKNLETLSDISKILKVNSDKILYQLESNIEKTKNLEKKIEKLNINFINIELEKLINQKANKNIFVIVHYFDEIDVNTLRIAVDIVKNKMTNNDYFIFFLARNIDKMNAILAISDTFKEKYNETAKTLMKKITDKFGGGSGGRDNMVQAGLRNDENIKNILDFVKDLINKFIN
ncbi:MAG: alanine--tRNA ligase [Elusimicrobiota bacterium]|nr:alanine--tRNA ligase [Elusimicrobiota bacterium]